MADRHRVEFIGAGPGDPDLLTVAGLRRLQGCSAVLAPAAFTESFADLLADREVASPFQMPHAELVQWVEERLTHGSVAFLVPGDFGAFCPFQSFVAPFGALVRVTPGIGAHAAAAALLQKTFDLPGTAHATILTSPRAFTRSGERVRVSDYARPGHTLILYMNDIPLPELVVQLRAGFGEDVSIAILERISCSDQHVVLGRLSDICERVGERDPFGIHSDSPEPTLALTIVGDSLTRDEAPGWWDRRYERIWRPRGVR